MHEKLSNPPLTYVLAQVNISPINFIEKFVPELQEAIRHEFPLPQIINSQRVEVRQNSEIAFSQIKQWHFKDKLSTTGILLDSTAITMHTSAYEDFNSFITCFKKILIKFHKILDISLSLRLGLRYINLIQPVQDYVKREFLGFYIDKKNELERNKFLAKVETIRPSKVGILRVQSAHVGSPEFRPNLENFFVFPDLTLITKNLSFNRYKEPKDRFVILDIDHYNENQIDFSVLKIIEEFSVLHEGIYNAFSAAITDKAFKEWK